jgi:hypothetical protein
MNTHIRNNLEALNGYVLKTADESVTSSAVLQNDDHLLWTIPQAGTYIVDCHLFAISAANAAGDITLGFSFPTGTFHFYAQGADATLASGSVQTGRWLGNLSATSGTTSVDMGLSATQLAIKVHGILIATASGTLRLMWAQMAANASASTIKAGSHMLVRQVA